MKISLIGPSELGHAELTRWRQLQHANPHLASPCFAPEFTLAAAAARPDVRIAVLEDGGAVVGFFPHQQRWGVGLPVGGRLCDRQGVIAASGTTWHWSELLKRSRLAYWQFNHLEAWQSPPVEVTRSATSGLDLSNGFDPYYQRKLASSSTIKALPRKLRKLEREVGPLRFELDSRDHSAFETVIQLKSEQCRRTEQLDYFSWRWTRELVERVRDTDEAGFGGCLSTLYAGDTLVAAHFGMRSSSVLHWWFPVYNQAHCGYSPGSLLLLQVAQAAAAQGHTLLDLGKGDEAYKQSFADCSTPLVEGIVSRPTLLTAARSAKKATGAWLRSSPLAQPLQPLLRSYRKASSSLVS